MMTSHLTGSQHADVNCLNEILFRLNGLLFRLNGLLFRLNGLFIRMNGLLIRLNELEEIFFLFYIVPLGAL